MKDNFIAALCTFTIKLHNVSTFVFKTERKKQLRDPYNAIQYLDIKGFY